MSTPTSRSLEQLRKDGYKAQVVERFNIFAHVRVDLFGFIDIVAISPQYRGVLGVQTTSASNLSARVKKILSSKEALMWINCGNRIEIHGWAKKGKTGKRKLWTVNIKQIYPADFVELSN